MKKLLLSILILVHSLFAGKFDDAIKSFETAPGYVAPIATILGTFGSTGWNQRSSIPRDFSGVISLPITFAVISDKDRFYTDVFVDTNLIKSNASAEEKKKAYIEYTTPTIFGNTPAPTLQATNLDLDNNPAGTSPIYFSDGVNDVAAFNWLPLPALQMEFSALYTAIKLRYLGKPGKSLGVHFPGIGIQHDLNSLLPELPVNFSIFGNFSRPILNWRPEDSQGALEMRGFNMFTGLTVGKSLANNRLDVLFEAGWEHSTLQTEGKLILLADNDTITPNMTLTGRNKLRAGVVVAFTPGKRYRLSGGAAVGSEAAFMTDIVAFRFGANNHSETKQKANNSVQKESTSHVAPTKSVQTLQENQLLTEPAPADTSIPANSDSTVHIEENNLQTQPTEE